MATARTSEQIDALESRLTRYLTLGAGDTVDEAVEGNGLAMESRAVIKQLRAQLATKDEALKSAASDFEWVRAATSSGYYTDDDWKAVGCPSSESVRARIAEALASIRRALNQETK